MATAVKDKPKTDTPAEAEEPARAITIGAKALADAMKHAASVVEGRNTIPILANVRLIAEGDTLEVTTSNLDVEFRQRLPLASGGTLATTVDARKLAQLAGAVEKGAQIALAGEDGGNRLTVRSGRSRWVLPALPVDDFPTIAHGALPAEARVSGVHLARALRRVMPFFSTELTKYYLHGPLLHPQGGAARLVATNGHCMSVAPAGFDWPAGVAEPILAPKWCQLAAGLAAEADGEVDLAWNERLARIVAGPVTLLGKTIDGQFPDYRRVIPQESERVAFAPEDLMAAVRRVQLVADQKTRAVKLEREDGRLVLSVASVDSGTAREEMPAESAAGHVAGFNAAYLAAMAEAIGGETIEMHHADPGAPALLRRVPGDGALGVIMPMRV